MKNIVDLGLKRSNNTSFYYDLNTIEESKKDLEMFLSYSHMPNSLKFAKSVMFSHEIQANNQIEGYNDDIEIIKKAIEHAKDIDDNAKRMRILNLYHAYRYILTHKDINKETLRELYGITSKDLLSDEDLNAMGEYYRMADVDIFHKCGIGRKPDKGVPAKDINIFMEEYLNFLYKNIDGTKTDEYIKSQILHFYFVYIHPYFDVNGRMSRTVAMWYLLNKKAYPYIIFNRGISFNRESYIKTISKTKITNDLSYFIKLMLDTVKEELEKEYIIQAIESEFSLKLSVEDFSTLLYFLSIKGDRTIVDYASMYNSKNDKKSIKEIYDEMLEPLLDMGILEVERVCKKEISGVTNKVLRLRPIDIDKTNIKHVKIN